MKRYFWLKLKEDFFDERYIKALRRLPSGDSLAIVYLKMQLKSLKTEGIIKYEGLLPDSVAELAMALDEDDNVVRLAVEALIRFGVIERWDDETIYMSAMQNLIGSESDSAERVRKHRALQKEAFKLPSNDGALHCNEQVTACNTEKEREKDSDKEKEKSTSYEVDSAHRAKRTTSGARKPLVHSFEIEALPDDWRKYCQEVRPDLNPDAIFAGFKFYWTSGNGAGKRKGDKGWSQAWQNWVRKGNEPRANGSRQLQFGPKTFEPDFSQQDFGEGGFL